MKLAPLFIVVVWTASVAAQSSGAQVSFEAEQGSRNGSVAVITDANAAGGQAVHFAQSDTGPTNPPVTTGLKCNLYLHGAGQQGGMNDHTNGEGIFNAMPRSPYGAFWEYDGPHNYQQTPQTGEDYYQNLVNFLNQYLEDRDCGPTVVRGGSNGGGLAAKLYCRGEDFGGRAWGYILDDPVMDVAVVGCSPSPNIRNFYLNNSVELVAEADRTAAQNNGNCANAGWGWYCEDNRTMTLTEYESHLDTQSVRSCQTHSGQGCTYVQTGMHVNYLWWENEF